MRKALIAIVVASGLFAVGALAANFTVQSDDVASGNDDVVACATDADVDFVTDTETDADGEFTVSGAAISFTEAPSGACAGQDVRIAVGLSTDSDASTIESWTEYDCTDVASASSSCTFAHLVSQIEEVSVLVQEIPVTVD